MCLNLKYEDINIIQKDENVYKISVSNKISEENLLSLLKDIYSMECEKEFKNINNNCCGCLIFCKQCFGF